MCGIYGELGVEADPRARERFARGADAALSHRGPDGTGVWQDGFALLGHRRLAIIDLAERANQPMVSASGRSVIAFNGEIYNYRELRDRMAPPTGGWRTESDTEVLVELLEREGLGALRDVVGMFAFALWQPRERRMFVVRDRLGKKPLYYHLTSKRFRFASEAPALLADGTIERTTTLDRVAEFLQHGYVAAPRSAFAALQVLPPGHCLRIDERNGTLDTVLERYWSIPEHAPAADRDAFLEEFRATLEDATRIRLRSDVPLGAFLSGGIDSSVVCGIAARQLGAPLRTFTVDFSEKEFSEGPWAAEVARHIGARHTEITLPAASIEAADEVVRTYGDLHGDPSALPTMAICREMRRHVTVAISGDGGDELLAGYARYFYALQQTGRASRLPAPAVAAAQLLGRHLVPSWVRGASFLSRVTPDLDDYYAREVRMYPPARWPSVVKRSSRGSEDPVIAALGRHSRRPALLRMMAADAETYLPEDNLVKVDRASMAVGLEVRAPLLDHRLFEIVSRARPEWLFDGARGKRPLRDLYASSLPSAVFTRKKMGFSVPLNRWMNPRVVRGLAARLLHPRAPVAAVLDRTATAATLAAYSARVHGSAGRLWHLYVLERWFDQHRPRVVNA